MTENIAVDRFAQLSQILIGTSHLDPDLAVAYLGRLRAEYPSQVADTLTAFAAIAQDRASPLRGQTANSGRQSPGSASATDYCYLVHVGIRRSGRQAEDGNAGAI
jgi:hypothetical protein